MNSCKTSWYFTQVGGFAFMLHRLIYHFFNQLWKNWTFVNFCDIDNLPAPIYTVRPYPVTMWRFAPLGDDQVDVMLSRDLDSEILKREYDAVSEWLNSTNKSLHIMRDHFSLRYQCLEERGE
ncbi:hypothetical protein Avbf_17536 [Armadillidium vulgare]|nr:hypothetical protein Avbf_17536 [Armadillidium vulgare]